LLVRHLVEAEEEPSLLDAAVAGIELLKERKAGEGGGAWKKGFLGFENLRGLVQLRLYPAYQAELAEKQEPLRGLSVDSNPEDTTPPSAFYEEFLEHSKKSLKFPSDKCVR